MWNGGEVETGEKAEGLIKQVAKKWELKKPKEHQSFHTV